MVYRQDDPLTHLPATELLGLLDRREVSSEEIVRAHEYVEAGHKKGNVVVTMPATSG